MKTRQLRAHPRRLSSTIRQVSPVCGLRKNLLADQHLLWLDDPLESQKIADADRLKMQNLRLNKLAETWLQKKLFLELLKHTVAFKLQHIDMASTIHSQPQFFWGSNGILGAMNNFFGRERSCLSYCAS